MSILDIFLVLLIVQALLEAKSSLQLRVSFTRSFDSVRDLSPLGPFKTSCLCLDFARLLSRTFLARVLAFYFVFIILFLHAFFVSPSS